MAKLEVYSLTDKGKRAANEDNLIMCQIGDVYLLAVADGLGGQASGEVASKIALVEMEEYLKVHLKEESGTEALPQAISAANKEIYLLSQENTEYRGMGSTLVTALICGDKALIANVGDSRAYLIKDEIKQITRDHSLVQEMVDSNVITREQARHDLQKNIVTRTLGTGSDVQADLFEVSLSGGTLMLCSDGLPDALKDDQIMAIIKNSENIESACNQLIDQAKEEGGRDNITLILARLEEDENMGNINN
jgi:PPM family protein phosphatase